MKKENDILKRDRHLKEMPYSVPDGYFDAFMKVTMKTPQSSLSSAAKQSPGRFRQAGIKILSAAAAAALLVTGGTFILKQGRSFPASEENELMALYSDMIQSVESDELYSLAQTEETYADENDIIEYLIYTGVSAETIESLK